MRSPEYATEPAKIYDAQSVINALEHLQKDDYAEAINEAQNIGFARHAKGYENEITYLSPLQNSKQLPISAWIHLRAAYDELVSTHEAAMADIAERTNTFLDSHPSVLMYADREWPEEWLMVQNVRLAPSDKVHRVSHLELVNNHDQPVWLTADTPLYCNVGVFEPDLQTALEPLLNPDETTE